MKKVISAYVLLSVCCIVYSADDSIKDSPSLPFISPVTEQLLKEEIRNCGVPAIRQRMQEAVNEVIPQEEGIMCQIPIYLVINKIFYASSEDQLSRTIFDIAIKNGIEKEQPISQQPIHATPSLVTFAINTSKHIDYFSQYRILDNDMQTIKYTALINNEELIEEAIADVERNG